MGQTIIVLEVAMELQLYWNNNPGIVRFGRESVHGPKRKEEWQQQVARTYSRFPLFRLK